MNCDAVGVGKLLLFVLPEIESRAFNVANCDLILTFPSQTIYPAEGKEERIFASRKHANNTAMLSRRKTS
jgi:hypothetical protein